MSLFKRVFCVFGAVVVLVCSLCIPAFASEAEDIENGDALSELEAKLESSPSLPYLSYFPEGGFYWLNGLVTNQLKILPVHRSPSEFDPDDTVPDHTAAPEYINVDGVNAYFKQTYPDDNVYEFIVAGVSAGFYSLLDIDGTGYYTGLMGSPCEYAYLSVKFPKSLTGLSQDLTGYLRARAYKSEYIEGLFVQSNYLTFTDNVRLEWDNEDKTLTAYYDCDGKSYESICVAYHVGDPSVDNSSLPAYFAMAFPSGKSFSDIDTSGAGSIVFLYGGDLQTGVQVLTKDFIENSSDKASEYEFVAYGITPSYSVLSAVGSAVSSVVAWCGTVVSLAISSPLLLMLSIGIAVCVFAICFKWIKKISWGA